MSALSMAAGAAMDTVKTKIGSEALSMIGVGQGASWGESLAAAGAVKGFEAISGHEMGTFSKMALTQGIAFGLNKLNGPEGGSMLGNLGMSGLTAGGLAAGNELFSKMGSGDGVKNAFDGLFKNIGEYSNKFLGEYNVVSNTIGKLGFGDSGTEAPSKGLNLSSSQSKVFDTMDMDGGLMESFKDQSQEKSRRNLLSPSFLMQNPQ